MSAYNVTRHATVTAWTYVRDSITYPFHMLHNASSTNPTVATTTAHNTPAYETPYVWAREFLEESGFNLIEQMPAILSVHKVPGFEYKDNFPTPRVVFTVLPQLILELFLHFLGGIFDFLVNAFGNLGLADVAWLLLLALVIVTLYLFRHHLMAILSKVWKELEEDVANFNRRHFLTTTVSQQQPTIASNNSLPPGAIVISAEDMRELNTSADAIQRRINFLRMSKVNFVRSHTGIVSNLNTSQKLQKQLVKAQEALKKEKAAKARPVVNFVRSRAGTVVRPGTFTKLQKRLAKVQKALEEEKADHQDTKDFLKHQTNARADAEELVEELRAKLEAEIEQNGNTQLETIKEAEDESLADGKEKGDSNLSAQVERLEKQLEVEQANYKFVYKKKEVFRHGGGRLKKELETLQAEYNVLEDSRDTWKETCEAMEEQADVKAVRALRNQMSSDKAHNERRIGALETQLGIEKSSREEAQRVVRELRERFETLEDEVDAARAAYNNLAAAHHDFGSEHGTDELPRMEDDEELKELRERYGRIQAEMDEMDARHQEELNAEGTGPAEGESWRTYEFRPQQPQVSRVPEVQEGAPLRRVQSAPLWLPLPHHGDTFDPLYDVSDYGDDDRESEDGNGDRGEGGGNRDAEHDSGNDGGEGPGDDDDDDDDDADDGRAGGADKAATDAETAQDDHVADSPAVNVTTLEPSSQRASFSLNGSVPEFVPSVRSGSSVSPALPDHTPAPKVTGPQGVKNPHIQKLNQEVKRLEWRRKSGMPDSAEEEEGHAGPDDMLDDMFDRQVAQYQSFAPVQFARGSMWGALTDLQVPVEENAPASSSGSPEADEEAGKEGEWSDEGDEGHEEEDEADEESGEEEEDGTDSRSESHASSPGLPRQNIAAPISVPQPQASAMRRPSNYFPDEEYATKTYEEEVGEAFANYAREHGTRSLGESMWAPKPKAEARVTAPPTPSRLAEEAALPAAQRAPRSESIPEAAPPVARPANRLPSNFFAGIENATRTHDEEVGDAFAEIARELGVGSLRDSIWAQKPEAKAQDSPQQARSTPVESAASSPRTPNRSGIAVATRAPPRGPPNFSGLPTPQPPSNAPAGPRAGASPWSPRERWRGGRDSRGGGGARTPQQRQSTPHPSAPTRPVAEDAFNVLGNSGRSAPQAQQAPARPRAEPVRPAAESGHRSPGFGVRGRGGGRAGRGGQGTPAPRVGPARGPRSGNASSDAFRRWQERMAREGAQ